MRLPKIQNHARAINIAYCSFEWNPATQQLEIYEQSREITKIERGDVGTYRLYLKHKPSFWKRTVNGDYISYYGCHYRAHAQVLGLLAEFATSIIISGAEVLTAHTERWIVNVFVKTCNPQPEAPAWQAADAPLAIDIWDNESPAAKYYQEPIGS